MTKKSLHKYHFKGKYCTSKEIWLYYLKHGISITEMAFREQLKEKQNRVELIDEKEIIEIVTECIIKKRDINVSMRKAIIEEFGEDVLNEILKARKLKRRNIKNRKVYFFKGKTYTSKEIWMYYTKCGISISDPIFREQLKEKEDRGELIDEHAIIEIVKICIIRSYQIKQNMKEAIIKEFGEEVLSEILEARRLRNKKRYKNFRDSIQSEVSTSVKAKDTTYDNSILSKGQPEVEK